MSEGLTIIIVIAIIVGVAFIIFPIISFMYERFQNSKKIDNFLPGMFYSLNNGNIIYIISKTPPGYILSDPAVKGQEVQYRINNKPDTYAGLRSDIAIFLGQHNARALNDVEVKQITSAIENKLKKI